MNNAVLHGGRGSGGGGGRGRLVVVVGVWLGDAYQPTYLVIFKIHDVLKRASGTTSTVVAAASAAVKQRGGGFTEDFVGLE